MFPVFHSFNVCPCRISLVTRLYAWDRFCRATAVSMNFRATLVAALGSLTVGGTCETSFAGRLVSGAAVEWPVFEYLQPRTPTIAPTTTTPTIHGSALRQPGFLIGGAWWSKMVSMSTATSE